MHCGKRIAPVEEIYESTFDRHFFGTQNSHADCILRRTQANSNVSRHHLHFVFWLPCGRRKTGF